MNYPDAVSNDTDTATPSTPSKRRQYAVAIAAVALVVASPVIARALDGLFGGFTALVVVWLIAFAAWGASPLLRLFRQRQA